MEETLQRRRVGSFIGQRQRQELIQRVIGLDAKPFDNFPAPAETAENIGVELEGRREVRALQQTY